MSNENSLSGSLGRPTRLLLISSRARNKPAIYASVWPHIKVLEFNYDSSTIEELRRSTVAHLGGTKVRKYNLSLSRTSVVRPLVSS